MPGEEIALSVIKTAVEKGLNKLAPKHKAIVFNSVQALFGLVICIVAVNKLRKALSEDAKFVD